MKVAKWAVLAASAAAATTASADGISNAFALNFTLTQIARPAGLPGGWPTGGILIDPNDASELWIGEYANYSIGQVVSSAVVRDPSTNNIVGFTGSLSTTTSSAESRSSGHQRVEGIPVAFAR